jgi:CheY-like chemotaxis protein
LLFAEDDPVLRKLTGRILEQAGYTVLYATDGVEAVRLFQDHSNRVAAAVLDILMPRMTGDAALRHMRELRPELRAVYVTGYCDYAGLDAEAPLLQKPVATADLLATLRAVLDGVLVGR